MTLPATPSIDCDEQFPTPDPASSLEEILLHTCEPLGDGVASPHTKSDLRYIQDVDLAVMRRVGIGGPRAIELRLEVFNRSPSRATRGEVLVLNRR